MLLSCNQPKLKCYVIDWTVFHINLCWLTLNGDFISRHHYKAFQYSRIEIVFTRPKARVKLKLQ